MNYNDLSSIEKGESSADIKKRVDKARKIQTERSNGLGIHSNSQLTADLVKKFCKIDENSKDLLKMAITKYQLSGRRYDRVLKLSRTIADLDNSKQITAKHLTQALQYRLNEPEY